MSDVLTQKVADLAASLMSAKSSTLPSQKVSDLARAMSKLGSYAVNDSIPAQIVKSAYSGLTIPGDVLAGKADPYDYGRALDFSGLATGAAGISPADPNDLRMGAYFRRTAGSNPDNGAGYMMFADNADRIAPYGKNLWHFESDDLGNSFVDSTSPAFTRSAYKALREEGHDPATARSLVQEAAPSDIVNSAGLWDDPAAVQTLWDKVLEKRGINGVKTPNGAVVFDPSFVKALNAGNAT